MYISSRMQILFVVEVWRPFLVFVLDLEISFDSQSCLNLFFFLNWCQICQRLTFETYFYFNTSEHGINHRGNRKIWINFATMRNQNYCNLVSWATKKRDCCFACSRMPSHSKKKLSSQKFEIHLSRQMIKQRQKEETQTITRSTKTKKTQTNHKMKIQQLLQSKRK